jgi:Carboxypeptidase regulatory-like domain
MMRRSLCFVFLLFCASPAWGQANFGTIVGTVLDPSGGTLAGAKLTVTNEATNTVRTAETDTAGQYEVPGLIPGTYTIQVSASGFAPKGVTGVVIDVQSRQSGDFTLAVGPASEQVTATAAPPLWETQSAFVGGVINSTQIVDLPLKGRRYSDLALLQAGVSTEPPGEKAPPFGCRFVRKIPISVLRTSNKPAWRHNF